VAIHVGLEHRTSYRFDRPINVGAHLVRLRPAPHCRTPIESYALRIEGGKHFVHWQQDPFGNHVARVTFPEPMRELVIQVDLIADMTVINPFDFFVDESAKLFPFEYEPALAANLAPYLIKEPASPELLDWLAPSMKVDGVNTVDFLADLNRGLARSIAYSLRLEAGVQTPAETLQLGIGSCRDSAWLLVAGLRELGLAARFCSGYLIQLSSDDPADELGQDFTDLHAWAEVFIPGAGWVGLDATSGLFAGEGHIPLSATPQPSDAAAITGVTDVAQTTMEFHNVVERVREDARVTKPYNDAQWASIIALGETVDGLLTEGDVRLTMGGEPTFVGATLTDDPEWNIDADGERKREMASELTRKLAAHYAPSGVIHHGQGKWYPGEALPRWQKAIVWRADGAPLWARPDLLDDPDDDPRYDDAHDRAGQLVLAIADQLGVESSCVLPAYEDRLAQLANEARLPEGLPPEVDPDEPLGRDDRAALIAQLDEDTGAPTGWVLPLHPALDGEGWASSHWTFRRGRVVLFPGTSPVGLRLPLDGINWVAPPPVPEDSAFADEPPFERFRDADITPKEEAPITALCVEARGGHVLIFLPPLERPDIANDLLNAICTAAEKLSTAVVLEGYPLPGAGKNRTLTVTPDPGVIEVNVHPSSSWAELLEITTTLDVKAREVGLATEKFALDGIHVGTGGGSHLTLGGITPKDSPLLRRPDLLVSLLTFWQHHPSLSYLFAGRFIGPTSQAPRVDEARHDYLYELEIAFAELTKAGEEVFPWTVDRTLRHLLTDLTGNTHRAEFCIDKLHSPDSERGRLGLLELRGFEMPPHPQMSAVQALLVRALVARFWKEPYSGRLVRWGTELHDRFLLPAGAEADINDVVADLNAHDIPFERSWLDPFLEFRFPRLGNALIGPVQAELRAAIEPWHVLGEEATANGTARYVDSSVERVQVSLFGAVPGRHVLTCNGVPVPLRAFGDHLVAGVRFKAWQPYSALHPSIGVQSPLVFDLVDNWTGQAMGGFTHHVIHPGGRGYDVLPLNAKEAEARRSSRFTLAGHYPGAVEAARTAPDPSAEYPFTLDLRRAAIG
jgi:uncharacterized protein (DUF2126 family)/transglutaminase-like putative cysteine protease